VASDKVPVETISSSTASYWLGLVRTPTCSWFFAAARTMEGPPMSISSIEGLESNG